MKTINALASRLCTASLLALAMQGCGGGSGVASSPDDATLPPSSSASTTTPAQKQAVIAWGDSFSADQYPGLLANLTGREVTRAGVHGQTSAQIAARQGALPTRLTVTGNSVPASGPVKVTSWNVMPALGTTVDGTLGETAGTLAQKTNSDGSLYYDFTRTTSGSAVDAPASTLFAPTTARYKSWINVLWMGRNDTLDTNGVKAASANIDASAAWVDPSAGHVIVLTVMNGNMPNETINQTLWIAIKQLNDKILSNHANESIDIRRLMIDEGLQRAGITPTEQDRTDIANDVPPTSLRKDFLHLNAAGEAVVAGAVADFIQAKGW